MLLTIDCISAGYCVKFFPFGAIVISEICSYVNIVFSLEVVLINYTIHSGQLEVVKLRRNDFTITRLQQMNSLAVSSLIKTVNLLRPPYSIIQQIMLE